MDALGHGWTLHKGRRGGEAAPTPDGGLLVHGKEAEPICGECHGLEGAKAPCAWHLPGRSRGGGGNVQDGGVRIVSWKRGANDDVRDASTRAICEGGKGPGNNDELRGETDSSQRHVPPSRPVLLGCEAAPVAEINLEDAQEPGGVGGGAEDDLSKLSARGAYLVGVVGGNAGLDLHRGKGGLVDLRPAPGRREELPVEHVDA